MNWNDIHVFLVIAREKSLACAALTLGVTHSTVFRKLNALEKNINIKLFSRNTDGYVLTETGKEVLAYAENISTHIDDLNKLLNSRNTETQGIINVTAPHNLAYNFLPRYFYKFNKKYPDISIKILVSNKNFNLSRLDADLAIRATQEPPENLIAKKLLSLKWGAYASIEYLSDKNIPLTLDDLNEHLLISSDQALSMLPAYQWIESNIHSSKIIVRCNDLMSMSAFAESNLGIAFLPDDQAKPELQRLFDLPSDIMSDIWMLIHPDMRQCKRLIILRDFLLESFRNDPLLKQHSIY
ncbi:MAG: LysR family transcriptional regulator [Bacteroidota bacterium]